MNDKSLVLHKLLRLGDLDPDEARLICGWDAAVFGAALRDAVAGGLVEWARNRRNQRMNRITACALAEAA